MAQVAPAIEWQVVLGGSQYDQGYDGVPTNDGGYAVVGLTQSDDGDITNFLGVRDLWVVKLDALGGIEWQKTFGGSSYDEGYEILQSPDSGYVVVGATESTDGDLSSNTLQGDADVWLLKLNSSGDVEWSTNYGGSYNDFGKAMCSDGAGGYVLACAVYSNDGDVTGHHGNFDVWVVRVDSVGGLVWQNAIGGTDGDHPERIRRTSSGNFILTGRTYSDDWDVSDHIGQADYWTAQVSASGVLQWASCLGGTDPDDSHSVVELDNGDFLISGGSPSLDGHVSSPNGSNDLWIARIDASGNFLSDVSLGGSNSDAGRSMEPTLDGGLIHSGGSRSTDGDVTGNHGMSDVWVVKTDASGALVWQKSMGGSDNEMGLIAHEAADGGFFVVGDAASADGDVASNQGLIDLWVVKLVGSSLEIGTSAPQWFAMNPNPAHDRVHLTLNMGGNTTLVRITDMQGRPVRDDHRLEGPSFTIDTSDLEPGAYVVTISCDWVVESQRLVVH